MGTRTCAYSNRRLRARASADIDAFIGKLRKYERSPLLPSQLRSVPVAHLLLEQFVAGCMEKTGCTFLKCASLTPVLCKDGQSTCAAPSDAQGGR